MDRYFSGRYTVVLLAALLADLTSKQLATTLLGERALSLGERFGLMLVYNQGGPGGISYGPFTWHINVLVTAIAIVLISAIAKELGRFHTLAPTALGLVAGGALGNLLSMIFGPAGVADFIAIHLPERSIVFNIADVALWSGALSLTPVVARLISLVRIERSHPASAEASVRSPYMRGLLVRSAQVSRAGSRRG